MSIQSQEKKCKATVSKRGDTSFSNDINEENPNNSAPSTTRKLNQTVSRSTHILISYIKFKLWECHIRSIKHYQTKCFISDEAFDIFYFFIFYQRLKFDDFGLPKRPDQLFDGLPKRPRQKRKWSMAFMASTNFEKYEVIPFRNKKKHQRAKIQRT